MCRRIPNIKLCIKKYVFIILIFLGAVIGLLLGIILKNVKKKWTPREIMYIKFPGQLFLRMLNCLVLPLVICSIISAIGHLNLRTSTKIGIKTIVYYSVTTVLAVAVGISVAAAVQPGSQSAIKQHHQNNRNNTVADTILDLIRNLVPPNIVEACLFQYRTVLVTPQEEELNVSETGTEEVPLYQYPVLNEYVPGTNIIGIVFVSIMVGIALSLLESEGEPLLIGFTCLGEATLVITMWIMWLSPIGVQSLIAGEIVEIQDFTLVMSQLGFYMVTILVGLFIHGAIILPLIYFIMTRQLPFRFIINMVPALSTAWITSSSSATLPMTIKCLETKNLLDPRIVRFVIPIGSAINMDGSTMYEAATAIFIMQLHHIPLDVGMIFLISLTATLASVSAAGVPQGDLVTMVTVLYAVGLSPEDAAIIIVVDWFLDRFRTLVNVLGDSIGAGVIDFLSKKDLPQLPSKSFLRSYS